MRDCSRSSSISTTATYTASSLGLPLRQGPFDTAGHDQFPIDFAASTEKISDGENGTRGCPLVLPWN